MSDSDTTGPDGRGHSDFGPAAVQRWLDATKVHPERAPGWMHRLVTGVERATAADITTNDHPAEWLGPRQSAVLVLLVEGEDGPEVVLQRRALHLRHHPGEVSFPGGRREDTDRDPVATALRETEEEIGLDVTGVDAVAMFPRLELLTGFHVTAVLAHWRVPSAFCAVDPGETDAVRRVPLSELADPDNRFLMSAADGVWLGPAFQLRNDIVWGFTGEVVDAVLRFGGWYRPWTPGEPRVWESIRA